MTQAVKRACDACHRRKVKCDGINPCRNCSSAQLSCTYNAVPQKKGPKGSRAKVISELRETQRQTSLSAKVQNRMNGIACPPNPTLGPAPGLLTGELVKDCARFFFENLYPQTPVIDPRQIEQQILYMEQNPDAYCLMTSLCAFIMLQPGMSMPPGDPYNLDMVPGANIISSQLLLEETLRVRKGYEYLDSMGLNSLVTNFFIFGCYCGQEMHDRAWYHLREATTMIHMMGMDKEEYYLQFDAAEAARRRRLYWLFFVIERAYAIQRQRPISLDATINPPTLEDDPHDPQSHQLNSFILLVNLYRPFDHVFTSVWNKVKCHLSPQFLNRLQKQLSDLVQSYACQDANFHDVGTNQQWLKTTVWQLTSGSVGGSGDDSMPFQFPLHMTRDIVVGMASQFPVQIDLVGPAFIEKMMEMTCFLADYLSLQAPSRDPFAVGPREHLSQIMPIVSMSRNGDHRFLPLLMSKMLNVLPRIANPMLQNAPENAALAQVDIFDGFGNAGMAQPPTTIQLPLASDMDRKFPVEEYDKKYGLEMNVSTPDSASASNSSHSNASPPMRPQLSQQGSGDVNASFVGSPAIMSPGMDYSHHAINGFGCTPMQDIAMNPLATPTPSQGQHRHHHQVSHNAPRHRDHAVAAAQAMRPQMIATHSMSFGHGQQQQQQQSQDGGYHLAVAPPMQPVGEYHGMHRPSADAMMRMNAMSAQVDYSPAS